MDVTSETGQPLTVVRIAPAGPPGRGADLVTKAPGDFVKNFSKMVSGELTADFGRV